MRKAIILAALLTAAPASAAPITLGSWQDVPAASNSGDTPWSHTSYDGIYANAGFVMGLGPGWQFVDAQWAFPYAEGVVWSEVYNWTAFTNRVISQTAGGAFEYRNLDTGDHYTSDGAGWEQWKILRRPIDALTTEYLVLLEDMGLLVVYAGMGPSDRDYNDSIWRAVERREPERPSVPEPASVAMMGLGLLAAARRLRRRG